MLHQSVFEYTRGDFLISTDKSKLDVGVIHQYLTTQSYWAKDIPIEIVEKAINNSVTYGIYHKNNQAGFGRVTTDFATFAYIADIFILEEYKKKGLSKWLMESIMSHPELQNLRRWMLMTQDAHKLYEKFGFKPLGYPDRAMEIARPKIYSEMTYKLPAGQ